MKKIILLILILPLSLLMAIDFTMTKDGLYPDATIEQVQTESTTSTATTSTQTENHAPTANNVRIQGIAKVGSTLTLNYSFNDIDQDTEGDSIIAWSTPTKELQRSTSKNFIIPEGYAGEEIGAWIQPIDMHGLVSTKAYPASNNYLTIENESTTPTTSSSTSSLTTTTSNTIIQNDTSTNKYLEDVNLPKCDANNPEVQFIRSTADWKTINSSSKRIFCVSPGDYTSLRNIKLTASGTAEKRRYIVLNNGNDLHPAQLETSQLAYFALEFSNASYWVLDRAAIINYNDWCYPLRDGSSHNIFNRLFVKNIYGLTEIKNNGNYNTIQNSRIDTMTYRGFADDVSAINIQQGSMLTFIAKGNKIVNNEFVNAKPGRCNRYPEAPDEGQYTDFSGTIVDSNTVEYTDAIRTDGNGNLNPNGEYIAGEATGWGLKGGSEDVNNPVIISNNHVWGYRPSDPTMKNLSNDGAGFVAYMGSKFVHIKNNVMFDGTNGIIIADRYDRPYGTEHAEVTGNLIVDCGDRPGTHGVSSSLAISQAFEATIKNNTVINPIGYSARVTSNYSGNNFGENITVNPDLGWYYNENPTIVGLEKNVEYATAIEGGYTEDYTFTTDKFTNNPRVITLKNVQKK